GATRFSGGGITIFDGTRSHLATHTKAQRWCDDRSARRGLTRAGAGESCSGLSPRLKPIEGRPAWPPYAPLAHGSEEEQMPSTVFAVVAAAAGALVLAVDAGAQPAPGFTELDSVSSAGVQGNQDSELPAVSGADGRYVAFASLSDNLVAGDTNGAVD